MLIGSTKCPGLFYATPAQDGILSRIRIPGGILTTQQSYAIAELAQESGIGYIDVTNRANLQIRAIQQGLNAEVLQKLQTLGLGAENPNIDQIRNIMTSPTAGIDTQELIDTRPLVLAWDEYIKTHPHLSVLPAKFSVGFDGGGRVSVSDRLNDISFVAVLVNETLYFRVDLTVGAKGKPPQDMGILLAPNQCLTFLVTLVKVYLHHLEPHRPRQLRLREVINNLGWENYLQEVRKQLDFPLIHKSKDTVNNTANFHISQLIGIHPQRQPGLYYMGVVLPLGRIQDWQLRGLADLQQKYGHGMLRLTPWQNLLLTDIPQQWLSLVKNEITNLGLDTSSSNIRSALVACSGSQGCAAGNTDTKAHALILAEYLETHLILDTPINIHFSACVKSCAQHHPSDITLLGVNMTTNHGSFDAYHIFVGEDEPESSSLFLTEADTHQKFGRQLDQFVPWSELPALIKEMLIIYKTERLHPDESFREFTKRYRGFLEDER